jgi:hypothetical protein
LLWALGSGFEGRDDLDEVYRFTYVYTHRCCSAGPAVMLFAAGGRVAWAHPLSGASCSTCRLGTPQSLPAAATPAVVGMRQGGRRRILIPPRYGWVDDQVRRRRGGREGGRHMGAYIHQASCILACGPSYTPATVYDCLCTHACLPCTPRWGQSHLPSGLAGA